jgi:hypothetical protein
MYQLARRAPATLIIIPPFSSCVNSEFLVITHKSRQSRPPRFPYDFYVFPGQIVLTNAVPFRLPTKTSEVYLDVGNQ